MTNNLGAVFEAGNGDEALKVMKANWLDLVLSDYNMPGMDGLELLRRMKAHDIMEDIPVVTVTTERSEQRVETFLSQGAAAYIKKPFTPEQIKSELNRILEEPGNGRICDEGGDEGIDEGIDF